VVICDIDQETGRALAAELNASGPGECHFEPCDVSQPAQLERVIEQTAARFGRLDCLINNAGQHPPHQPIDSFSIEAFKELLQLNLVSIFAACKYALPHLRETRGSIINLGSIVGAMGQWQATTYCASKGGVHGFTKALAIDEARHGVRVNAILPGNILTQSRLDLEATMEYGQAFHDFVETWQWTGRSGTIAEAGNLCLFLASDAASFVTGAEIPLTGGIELGQGPKVTVSEREVRPPADSG
jgi:NAD(P)-dependent dehydrogenase (short-subunit alcohol dehydrogenase family)